MMATPRKSFLVGIDGAGCTSFIDSTHGTYSNGGTACLSCLHGGCGPIHQSKVQTAWRQQLAMTVHYEPEEAGSWAGRDGGWKVSWVATGTGVHAGWCEIQSGVVRYTVVEGRSAGASAFYN